MRQLLQRTLKRPISCTGIGLHSGKKISLTLKPAPEDSGITFFRTDVPHSEGIKASLDNVVHTQLATTLGQNGLVVSTVEHLLAALAGLGVDNARIELSGPEVPVMDGSAAPFVYLIRSVGVTAQSRFKKFVVIRRPLAVSDNGRFVSVAPARELSIHFTISYDHPLIRHQQLGFRFSDVAFERDLSRARTFGFLHEVEHLKKNGYARGGSLSNAVVIDGFKILNPDGLRYPDEFIRHKILDFIGDVSLMGAPIIGSFVASKSGHAMNHRMLTQLAQTPDAWSLVEFTHPAHFEAHNVSLPSWGLLDVPTRQAA